MNGGYWSNQINGTSYPISSPTYYDPVIYPDTSVELTKVQLSGIIREELRSIDLDIDKINKLLTGGREDYELGLELLKAGTKYTWRIIEAQNDSKTLERILVEISINNPLNILSREWK